MEQISRFMRYASEEKLRVLIVGAGQGGEALLRALHNEMAISIAGVVDTNPDAPGIMLARSMDIPTASDWKEFFAAGKIDEVINATGSAAVHEKLTQEKPEGTDLVSGAGAKMLWMLVDKHIRSEEYLRLSEIKYRTLTEQIPAMIYIAALDDNSTPLYISPEVTNTIGVTPNDYKERGNLWHEHIHAEDRARVLYERAECRKSGKPFASEYRMLTKSGKTIYIDDKARIIRNHNGQPLYLQGVMFEITDR